MFRGVFLYTGGGYGLQCACVAVFMAGVRFIDPVACVCLWWFYSGLTAAFFVVVRALGDIRFRLPQRLITIVCS